jgi:hypothetical protein
LSSTVVVEGHLVVMQGKEVVELADPAVARA